MCSSPATSHRVLTVMPGELRRDFRLFCFHYAGGTAGLFADWQAHVPDWVDVCPVQLPGRGLRHAETPRSDLAQLAIQLADELDDFFDVPFAFVGCSMGAFVAYEVAMVRYGQGRRLPEHIYVAAQKAPTIPSPQPYWHDLPDDQLIDKLRLLGGTSEAALASESLMEMLCRILRADFALVETYAFAHTDRLPIDITAFCGDSDWLATPVKMHAWAEVTAGRFALEMMRGDHFFMQTHRCSFIARLSSHLSELRRGPTSTRGVTCSIQ